MELRLKINDRYLSNEELLPLMAQHLLLPQFVREVIIADATQDIECTPEEKEMAMQRFYQENKIETSQHLHSWLSKTGLQPEQVENLALRKIRVEKFKYKTWGDQLENYFLERKQSLDQVVYSLLRTKHTGVAQELFFRIQEEESSFSELAKKYSEGVESETGGLIGPVELNVPHQKIAQMLVTSEPGKLLPPTRIGEWLVIVRLEKLIRAKLDKSMEKRLLDELFQQWLNEEVNTKVSFLNNEEIIKAEVGR